MENRDHAFEETDQAGSATGKNGEISKKTAKKSTNKAVKKKKVNRGRHY
jgi:hypothetical protein